MKFLIVPDKFKGSLTAQEVSTAIEAGVGKALPDAESIIITASDGGDGFLNSVAENVNAEEAGEVTVDALGDSTFYGSFLFDRAAETAYIEMAVASGMANLPEEKRNPLHTTTLGTGILASTAISHGAKKIYVGLGGSATNDGGIGFAAALGYSFYDCDGNEIPLTGEGLSQLSRIEYDKEGGQLEGIEFFAVNDVRNPLFGAEGAAYVYAPQKGASPEIVAQLDKGLRNLDTVVQSEFGQSEATVPGAGAAGGLGYGLRVFCGAEFVSGVDFILSLSGIEEILSSGEIDCIITGEGKIDDQTAYGKLVDGVAKAGQRHRVPVYAICGSLQLTDTTTQELGLEDAIPIHSEGDDLSFTIKNAANLVEQKAEQLASRLAS